MSDLIVRVTPRAKQERVEQVGEIYRVWVSEPPEHGRANERVRKLLAEWLDLPLRSLILKRGAGSRTKVFSIED